MHPAEVLRQYWNKQTPWFDAEHQRTLHAITFRFFAKSIHFLLLSYFPFPNAKEETQFRVAPLAFVSVFTYRDIRSVVL